MSSANAGWFLSPLQILLPLLALPFLLAPEANLTNSTSILSNTTFMQTEQPKIASTTLPTTVSVTKPAIGGQEIQSQGPESTSTMTGQATLQRSENHTEAETTTGTSLDATSHFPEAKASPNASYYTEDPVRNSARVELTPAVAIVSEATTSHATPTLANTNTNPGLAAATTSVSQILHSSEASASETPLTTAAFATSRSSAAPETPKHTRPHYATTTLSSVTTPPSSAFSSIEPDSSSVWSTQLAHITFTFNTPTVMGTQRFPILWIVLVVLLVLAIFVGALCLGLWVKRGRRRSRVLHLGSHGYGSRKNKGKEGDAWAGPVTISSMAATATVREETEDEEEEKRKGRAEEEVQLSTFGVEGMGRTSPNGRRGVGRTGSTEARKWEEESQLLFIDEGQVEVETKAGANNLEGGGEGEVEEKEKEKEKEKDGKGLNGNEQTNGGTAFSYITAV